MMMEIKEAFAQTFRYCFQVFIIDFVCSGLSMLVICRVHRFSELLRNSTCNC